MVKGYKVFDTNWQCRGKQYTCPGKFEEDIEPSVCDSGMHFCKVAANCFSYYDFDPDNRVAEVIAYGDIAEEGDKCCTNKLEIVREIPWTELLEIINTGKGCTGKCNSGDYNTGDYNSGNGNSGNRNSGHCNTGSCNSGHSNTGNHNSGYYNTGSCNSGDYNSGNYNSGSGNTGSNNSGRCNSGHYNSGNYNSGDWNKTSFSNGCFNTKEPKIYLFNKRSKWTYTDWLNSDAHRLLTCVPRNVRWIGYNTLCNMTDAEKKEHPGADVTGGYLQKLDNSENCIAWWHGLSENDKAIIKAIPNFDKAIFKEITGIDVDCDYDKIGEEQ